jgi:2-polyprenyl-6-methoxyphenol hydroxylase-like FAD-dependent oxidoreductase
MTTGYVESQISFIKDSSTVKIAAILNGNRYRIRNALVETMYKPLGQGHVLLAGDSAHAFSPAGGQGAHLVSMASVIRVRIEQKLRSNLQKLGMNLGFCDAIALAQAVSTHIKSQENEVLTDYSKLGVRGPST